MIVMDNILSLRAYVEAYLLTDKCTIKPVTTSNTGSGTWNETEGIARVYNGSPDIPCRLDILKQYNQLDIFSQEAVTTNYYLFLPIDMDIAVNDNVYLNNSKYQIKELFDQGSWSDSKRVYVTLVR